MAFSSSDMQFPHSKNVCAHLANSHVNTGGQVPSPLKDFCFWCHLLVLSFGKTLWSIEGIWRWVSNCPFCHAYHVKVP